MDRNICKKIIENKQRLIPSLFTLKQINILEKYMNKASLTNTERTYLYSRIKKKVDALMIMNEQYFISGDSMIKGRIKKARDILKELNQEKAFISGSFLYSNKFNDIDIYIISNRRKQYHKGNRHLIFITEDDLNKAIFISASKYSVSNFFIDPKKTPIKRPSFNDLIVTYEIAINEILDNDDQKTIRDIIFEYYVQIEGVVLDSFFLYKKTNEIIQLKKEEKIEIINNMTKKMLIKIYSHKYLSNELTRFLKHLKNDIASLKINDNLIIYHNLLGEVKDECRKAET